jgi:tRNA-dihydrouridine synthase B
MIFRPAVLKMLRAFTVAFAVAIRNTWNTTRVCLRFSPCWTKNSLGNPRIRLNQRSPKEIIMQIGPLIIEPPVMLAPMAGVSDMPFRELCYGRGCALAYTEMASAKGLTYGGTRTHPLIEIGEGEPWAAVQLFGSEVESLVEAAKMAAADPKAALVDLNMGCPTPKIVKNGDGCALMRDPKKAETIIRALVDAIEKPVTVKIRLGWDAAHINAVEVAQMAENAGASAVAVHGRTRDQYYAGKADWEQIARVKENVSIPVIGNGDITGPQEAARMFAETGCDAVMIGRAARGNPWIFAQTAAYLRDGTILPDPTSKERIDMAFAHIAKAVAFYGERVACLEMKKHAAWYVRHIPGAASLRRKIFTAGSIDELKALFTEGTLL